MGDVGGAGAVEDGGLAMFALRPSGGDSFVAETPTGGPNRLFGGLVAGQAFRAATLTVDPERHPQSLHAYFLRPGAPGEPLHLTVDRVRDGASFSTRHVTADQRGKPIFTLIASFHSPEEGDDWQRPAPRGVPDPDDVDPRASFLSRMWSPGPFDVRGVHPWEPESPPKIHPVWLRARERLPDDPGLHASVLTFWSDMGIVGSALPPGTPFPSRAFPASLDHTIWFHRPARADEWTLFSVEPVSRAGARALVHGAMHDRDGVLLATIAQEGLIRGAY